MSSDEIDDYDRLLRSVGDFGWYQKTRFYFFCLPAVSVICLGVFVNIFTLFTPAHHCIYPMGIPSQWENGTAIDSTVLTSIFHPLKDPNYGHGYNKCQLKSRYVNKSYNIINDADMKRFIADQTDPEKLKRQDEADSLKQLDSEYGHPGNLPNAPVYNADAPDEKDPKKVIGPDDGVVCPNGMWYDRSDWAENYVTKFDLVCDRAPLVSTIYSMSNAGGIVGMLMLSTLQDQIGRKKTFFISVAWYVITGTIIVFMNSWYAIAAMVFLRAFSISSCFQIPWLIAIELVGPKRHVRVLICMCICFAIICVIVSGVAYLCTTWVQLVLITTLPALVMFGFVTYMDESGRWLLATGRVSAAQEFLKKVARINKATIPESTLDAFTEEAGRKLSTVSGGRRASGRRRSSAMPKIPEDEAATGTYFPTVLPKPSQDLTSGLTSPSPKSPLNHEDSLPESKPKDEVKFYGFWTLFSSFNLFAKTMIVSLNIAANLIVYSGFNLNIEHLGYNQYILFAVTSLTEIPAALAAYFTKYVGKLSPTAIAMIFAGIFSIISGQVPPGATWAVILFATLMKLCITFSFDLIYLVAGEIFPTVVRASGMGATSIVASLLNIATPFIIFTAISVTPSLPMTIFGIISSVAGLICLMLPESSGHIMLDSLEQAEEYRVGVQAFLRNISCYYARNRGKNAAKHRQMDEDDSMWISVPTKDVDDDANGNYRMNQAGTFPINEENGDRAYV